jgi:phosphoribosylaminoimidazole-succinocarboxamide synthase
MNAKDTNTKGLFDVDLSRIGLKNIYRGKVRTCATVHSHFVSVTTDRLSAFNIVSTHTVPYKGLSLNAQSRFFFSEIVDIIPTWVQQTPHPLVEIGYSLEMLPYEFVYRGIHLGSLHEDYLLGSRGEVYGLKLGEGLKKYDAYPKPIFTPTRKSENDEKISPQEMFASSNGPDYTKYLDQAICVGYTLFERMSRVARRRGLILADAKLEFGINRQHGYLCLADEGPTGDSARFFDEKNFYQNLEQGKEPTQFSKEYLRDLLHQQNWSGTGLMPIFTNEELATASLRYLNLTKKLTGQDLREWYNYQLQPDIFEEEILSAISIALR